jgi:hypothetical protein
MWSHLPEELLDSALDAAERASIKEAEVVAFVEALHDSALEAVELTATKEAQTKAYHEEIRASAIRNDRHTRGEGARHDEEPE